MVLIRNKVENFLYRNLAKPLFFMQDPEKVHDRVTKLGSLFSKTVFTRGLTDLMFNYSNKALNQKINGIKFDNPVGLAAGFDKNARLTGILKHVGFGYMELGSVTGEPCKGNPKPRLWRLVEDKSLVINYGLMNDGCQVISERLKELLKKSKKKAFDLPVGISIAKTNDPRTCDLDKGVSDYAKAYNHFLDIGSYDTINISCPNAYGGQPFHKPEYLLSLLSRLNDNRSKKPMFLKISPDLNHRQIDEIIKLAREFDVTGFICSNLTHDRSGLLSKIIPEKGSISGNHVKASSTHQISYISRKTNGEFTLVGTGGIFSAEDAYEKIKAGASLVQLITGMIFKGPQLISDINYGLVKLMKEDGYSKLSQVSE